MLGEKTKQLGILQEGDNAVITAGEPFGIQGSTNMMIVQKIS